MALTNDQLLAVYEDFKNNMTKPQDLGPEVAEAVSGTLDGRKVEIVPNGGINEEGKQV